MSDRPVSLNPAPEGYDHWLGELKARVHAAQQRAARAINRELVLLYWQIGQDILQRQTEQGWGAKVIERLAHDLRTAFPDMKGFSPRNLKYMRAFAQAWPDVSFVQEVLAQLPWYHQLALLDKLPSPEARQWYAAKAIEHNWSRNVLVMQIETKLLERNGQAVTNFDTRLPAPQSDLARESLKDPYRFDFLGLTDEAQEREIKHALVKHVTEFLLELGAGFAFVGRQVLLNVGGDEFFIDLLFASGKGLRTSSRPPSPTAQREISQRHPVPGSVIARDAASRSSRRSRRSAACSRCGQSSGRPPSQASTARCTRCGRLPASRASSAARRAEARCAASRSVRPSRRTRMKSRIACRRRSTEACGDCTPNCSSAPSPSSTKRLNSA